MKFVTHVATATAMLCINVAVFAQEETATAAPPTTSPTTELTAEPTTAPATQPVKRLDKFVKSRLARSPVAALKAMTVPNDANSDEAARFIADVQAGRWSDVAKTIASFPPDEAKQLYKHLITELSGGGGAAGQQMPPNFQQMPPEVQARMLAAAARQQGNPEAAQQQQFFMSSEDVLALIEASPDDVDEALIEPLGQLLGRALAKTNAIEPILGRLEQGIRNIGGPDTGNRARAANLLVAANRPKEIGAFLPKLDEKATIESLQAIDLKLLELHSKHLASVAMADDAAANAIERAWDVTNALLSHPRAAQKDRDVAMSRTLELLPKLSKTRADEWLAAGFVSRPEQGRSVLASAGNAVAQNLMSRELDKRGRDLVQQRKLVDQLLTQSVDAKQWAPALSAMATLWMQEADYARQRPTQKQFMQMQMRRNMGYYDPSEMQQVQRNPSELPPLEPARILEAAPSERWLDALDDSLRLSVRGAIVQMHFKNEQSAEALPIIESIAATYPKIAREWSNDLLRNLASQWQTNMNMARQQMSYIYTPSGVQMIGQGTTQTRSAQARSLKELDSILARIAEMKCGEPDINALLTAFVNAHSPAEVYRLEDVELVFGPPETLDRDAFFQLFQAMRQRLATSWRSPQPQQQAQTKRTDKDVEAEVIRGYDMLIACLQKRFEQSPDWRTTLLLASALFDRAEFDYGKGVELAVYTQRRDEAFKLFAKSAEQYKSALPELKPNEQSPLVYQQWFNAALGASDLATLTRQAVPSPSQVQQIRQAMLSLPGEAAEKHMTGFGTWLSESTVQLKPEIKHRFLSTGITVVGDDAFADDARKLVRYYEDLLDEVKLHAQIDGDANVGHTQPFGLLISIRHTQAVGRESGGFAKYVTNQQNNRMYQYYGGGMSAPVNYRDDFEKRIRDTLAERFEVVSIAWEDEKVQPIGFGKPDWRETPLAYVLIKVKDPSVDKIPALQMDLDMLDRQGTVILPTATQVILIDARASDAPTRPVSNVEITQVLDYRSAAEGNVSLEIQATARGILPPLEQLLNMKIDGFGVEKIADQPLAIKQIDNAGDRPAAVSERSWIVTLKSPSAPGTFRYPQAKFADAKVTYKRYFDADIADVESALATAGLPLEVPGASTRRAWTYIATSAIALIAIIVGWIAWRRRTTHRTTDHVPAYQLPRVITPFSVIDLLHRIESDRELGLGDEHRKRLLAELSALKEKYFARSTNGAPAAPELAGVASFWVREAVTRSNGRSPHAAH